MAIKPRNENCYFGDFRNYIECIKVLDRLKQKLFECPEAKNPKFNSEINSKKLSDLIGKIEFYLSIFKLEFEDNEPFPIGIKKSNSDSSLPFFGNLGVLSNEKKIEVLIVNDYIEGLKKQNRALSRALNDANVNLKSMREKREKDDHNFELDNLKAELNVAELKLEEDEDFYTEIDEILSNNYQM